MENNIQQVMINKISHLKELNHIWNNLESVTLCYSIMNQPKYQNHKYGILHINSC